MKDKPQLTSEQYVAREGLVCPFCVEGTISTGHIHSGNWDERYYVRCSCDRCGAHWNDVFELVGYEEEEP